MKFHHFPRALSEQSRQEINYWDNISPNHPAECDLIVFKTHNVTQLDGEKRLKSDQACLFFSSYYSWLTRMKTKQQQPQKKKKKTSINQAPEKTENPVVDKKGPLVLSGNLRNMTSSRDT